MSDIEIFERAFNGGSAGCRRRCDCGRIYYNPDTSVWYFEEGEIDILAADINATAVNHSVGEVFFEGREFVDACDCWKDRAAKIMEFLDYHGSEIADYLNLTREAKIAQANKVAKIDY